jgi:hypothetical protein
MKKSRVSIGTLVLLAIITVSVTLRMRNARGHARRLSAFEFIADPNISPDGKLVAYVVTKIDKAQNRPTLQSGWPPPTAVARPAIHHLAAILEFAALES